MKKQYVYNPIKELIKEFKVKRDWKNKWYKEDLDMLISQSAISDALVKVLDPERVRPTDITLQIPSSDKFREHFGWEPEKSLVHICDDLLNYWRKVL